MSTSSKPRVRLYVVGQATYRLVTRDRGYGGPYGMQRRPAKWACITCGRIVDGTDERPSIMLRSYTTYDGRRFLAGDGNACARNGHAPCAHCGKQLARTNDGCPRAHPWRQCPGKTEADRMVGQHAHAARHQRSNP